jgi:hypothetical protein
MVLETSLMKTETHVQTKHMITHDQTDTVSLTLRAETELVGD